LAECIESVLPRPIKLEYLIVNNCSTDYTLEIVSTYAKKDSRIRIHDNNMFVDVITNHNIAFRLISPTAKYCKVVSADDFIFPDCILRMVEVAEANPSVGIVGSYQLSEDKVRWQGFTYPQAVLTGRELCRRIFLENAPSFGFGSPTSLLYRADLVRGSKAFYPNLSPHSDTSACFEQLQKSNFGFVYQVLSYERIHRETQSFASATINRYISANLSDFLQYGPFYLSNEEFLKKLEEVVNRYYHFLAVNLFARRGKKFWDYHKGRLKELGYPVTPLKLLKACITKALSELMNPEQAVRKFSSHYSSKKPRLSK